MAQLSGEWDQLYSDFQTQSMAYQDLYDKATNAPWWLSKKARKNRLGALEAEGNRLLETQGKLNDKVKELGLEGTVPPLEDYSKETMEETMDAASKQQAESRATSIGNLQKVASYGGMALDVARDKLLDTPDAYGGKKGTITQSLDAVGDSFSDAAIASGNPYAMAAGAAYKALGFVNRAIGGGTDGMTGIDATLDSNLGFVLTGGLSKLNGAFGNTTDKFEVDNDVKSQLGNSYVDTYDELDDAASVAGKRYGFLSGKKYRKAQNAIALANQRQNTLSQINETAQDRSAASSYQGIGFRNSMSLNGGYQSMRAARQGLKLDLNFARKVTKAQQGLQLNTYDPIGNKPGKPVNLEQLLPDGLSLPKIEEGVAESEFAKMGPMDLASMGIYFGGFNEDGQIVFNIGDENLYNKLDKDALWQQEMMRRFKAKGVVLRYTEQSTTPQPEQPEQPIQPVQPTEKPKTSESQKKPKESTGSPTSPKPPYSEIPINIDVPNVGNVSISLEGFDDQEKENFALILSSLLQKKNKNIKINSNLRPFVEGFFNGIDDIEKKRGSDIEVRYQNKSMKFKIPLQSMEGVFNINLERPYTTSYKSGGSFNVIPDGALHKNKHHMEGAEGLTKKGIPVITEEDGKKVQQAEIEVNEIIFRLEVTEQLEKLAKEGTDEAALEAGKLITEEILHNTHDNTGLIKETV